LTVLDSGAGSGPATRRLAAAGARAVPVDAAVGMLGVARQAWPCTPVGGDALALPLLADSADAAVLGFVLNHLSRPAEALREAARVIRPGGWLLASTWARRDAHPIRETVQNALGDRGWRMPDWYRGLKEGTAPLSDTAEGLGWLARDAGVRPGCRRQRMLVSGCGGAGWTRVERSGAGPSGSWVRRWRWVIWRGAGHVASDKNRPKARADEGAIEPSHLISG
jgi:SAM-dependent methyltransferase